MYNHVLYIAYWAVNTTTLYVASLFLPKGTILLGSWRFNPFEASLYSGFWITFLIWAWWDFAVARRFQISSRNIVIVFAYFLFVNVFSLWAVSVFSSFTGFVLVNFQWALIIGAVTTVLQRVTFSFIVARRYGAGY